MHSSTLILDNYSAFNLVEQDYPHVAVKLKLVVGSPAFTKYITNLLLDSRDGNRAGFTLAAGSALAELSEIHDFYYPDCNIKFDLDKYS